MFNEVNQLNVDYLLEVHTVVPFKELRWCHNITENFTDRIVDVPLHENQRQILKVLFSKRLDAELFILYHFEVQGLIRLIKS